MRSGLSHRLGRKRVEMKWTTFDGRIADTETADHQHISNCLWFGVIFQQWGREVQEEHKKTLINRFGNKILPYRPHPTFHGEILGLINAGMVYLNDLGDTLIIVNGRIIGELLKPTHPMYYSTKT